MNPILTIVTRHMPRKRKRVITRMLESIDFMKDNAQKQIIIDDKEIGHPYAASLVVKAKGEVTGDYVWLLDDDDECSCPQMIFLLQRIKKHVNPDLIMARCLLNHDNVMPEDKVWNLKNIQVIQPKQIPMPAMIMKNELYQKTIDAIQGHDSRLDWYLMERLQQVDKESPLVIYWLDVIVMRQQTKLSQRSESSRIDVSDVILFGRIVN